MLNLLHNKGVQNKLNLQYFIHHKFTDTYIKADTRMYNFFALINRMFTGLY